MNSKSDSFFISLDLKYQLDSILKNEYFSNLLYEEILKRIAESDGNVIKDVNGGRLYKNLLEKYEFILTLNFNVDGAPIFHKSKRSMWNLQVLINELPTEIRFKLISLAGEMVTSHEPSPGLMRLYLTIFANQVKEMGNHEIKVTSVEGDSLYVVLKVLYCSTDLPARALVENRFQFNSLFGWSNCYIQGELIEDSMRFLTKDNELILRTNDSHKEDVKLSKKTKSKLQLHGIKGESALSLLADLDQVWGCAFDTTHTWFLYFG